MKRTVLIAAAAALLATPTIAQDIAEGEELTAKRCKSCHMISDGDNVILKGGKTGPNLYGVIGRTAGTADFKRYGKDLKAAGEAGLVWDEEQLIAYLEDPRAYLRTYLDDKKAKSKMSFKLKKEEDRANVAAYLASIGAATN
ncbi:MAG: c-type cytochrome [Pseudomonadota bacterium]